MSTPTTSAPKRGRPSLPAGERMEQRSIRLTAAQWAKVDAHGMAWLRALIDRSRPATGAGDKSGL